MKNAAGGWGIWNREQLLGSGIKKWLGNRDSKYWETVPAKGVGELFDIETNIIFYSVQ